MMKKMNPLKPALLLILSACVYDEPASFTDIDFIDVIVSSKSVEADGNTTTNLSVQFDRGLDSVNKEVTFETDLGTFSNDKKLITVTLDAFNKADADLKSSTIGMATITAKIGTVVSQQVEVSFTEALPDKLLLNLGTLSHTNGIQNKLTVTATLSRSRGKPTSGLEVKFSATGTSASVFGNKTFSNAEGIVTSDFAVSDTTFTGDITISASLVKNNTIKDDGVLTIIK